MAYFGAVGRSSRARSAAMAALTAAARRSLPSRLSGCFHPALSHLLTSHRSGDTATPSTLLRPASPLFRSHHFLLPQPQSSGTAAQTLTLFPFGIHLAGAAPFRRGFSSSPSYRVADAGAVLGDAADAAAAPTAPASFPSEVAWIAEDSSLSVAAVQHLIDSVHSFTGLNWWLSIAVSTVLLRYVLFALMLSVRKQAYVLTQEILAVKKIFDNSDDEESKEEAIKKSVSSMSKSLVPVACILILSPYTFMVLYYGISNMVEKLPSLKVGGAFWFTDLTAPDALYIFPAITALSLMIRLELSQHYSRRARSRSTDVLRMLYALSFPITASLPQAICCYFATWTFANLTRTIVINQRAVKKLLFSKLNKPRCPPSDGSTGSTTEDSSCNVDEHKHVPPERREASDSSSDQVRDQPDDKSEKGN